MQLPVSSIACIWAKKVARTSQEYRESGVSPGLGEEVGAEEGRARGGDGASASPHKTCQYLVSYLCDKL